MMRFFTFKQKKCFFLPGCEFFILECYLFSVSLADIVSVSADPNEMADFMVYKKPGEKEYLGFINVPLVPFDAIENVMYKIGDDISWYFNDVTLQFLLELNGGNRLFLEFGEVNGSTGEILYYDDEVITDYILVSLIRPTSTPSHLYPLTTAILQYCSTIYLQKKRQHTLPLSCKIFRLSALA